MSAFLEMNMKKELQDALRAMGLVHPTPVQEYAIPLLLEGHDVVAQAKTGTGKTIAFLLPILQKLQVDETHVQALIVTPTRELAVQITGEVKKLIRHMDRVNALAVYGGQDVEQQMKKLQGAVHIVVATPGRLLDHMRRGTVDISRISTLILDEADQMLHIGFLGEVEQIIEKTPPSRQTGLFSATMPAQVRTLAKRYMKHPRDVRIQSKEVTVEKIEQLVVMTTDRAKQTTLRGLLDEHRPFLAVIFCRTKRRASTLNAALQEYGYNCDELHGDLSQAKREKVMKRFRDAELQFLIATDVAARGLDVEGVTHVFNYDIPHDTETYIHRIGRTGRAGGEGMAVTLMAPKDRMYLDIIEKGIQLTIPKVDLVPERTETRDERKPVRKEERPGGERPRRPAKSGRFEERKSGKPERRGAGPKKGDSRKPKAKPERSRRRQP